jgi:DNA-binding FadR family transcriptional regulator
MAELITPARRTTLTTDICRQLVSHVLRGDWQEGDRIPSERELCQKLGVSRAPVREALKAMEIMGLLEANTGGGTLVRSRSSFLSQPLLWAIASSTETGAVELVEARSLVEIELAGLAAIRATTDDVKVIAEELNLLQKSHQDLARYLETDMAFHMAIAQAAHNAILLNALLLIRNLMREWIRNALRRPGVAGEATEQHSQIFFAIARRDPEKARQAMREHLTAMAKYLVESYAQGGASAVEKR